MMIYGYARVSTEAQDLTGSSAQLMQRAGAGIRSLAEPFLDTTSDFAEIVFAILGVAAKLEQRRIKERTARGRGLRKRRASNSGVSRSSPRTSSARRSGGATWTGKPSAR